MLLPLVTPDQSDSAYLDNMVEMLVHAKTIFTSCYDDAYPNSMGWQ
jgi:glutamate synthase domain-containing protein 1